jgi:hypothetical protein
MPQFVGTMNRDGRRLCDRPVRRRRRRSRRGRLGARHERPVVRADRPRRALQRQLPDAGRNARRAARGEAPEDVDAQLRALTAPAADPELRAEVRALVESRNARRVERGEEPLDVEAETERRLRELGA